MEHRADTLKRDDAERTLKENKRRAYLDPVKAEEAREKGNELFKAQKYPEAVEQYTEAIARNPDDHASFRRASSTPSWRRSTRRSRTRTSASRSRRISPRGTRLHGHVEFFTKQYDKALETYQAGLAKDPENEELKDGLRRTMIEIQRGQTGQVDEAEMKERQARAMQDPEIQNILQDPVMRQVLQDMSTDAPPRSFSRIFARFSEDSEAHQRRHRANADDRKGTSGTSSGTRKKTRRGETRRRAARARATAAAAMERIWDWK